MNLAVSTTDFIFATIFPEVDNYGDINGNENVAITMFPEVDKQGNIDIGNITFAQQCCPNDKHSKIWFTYQFRQISKC